MKITLALLLFSLAGSSALADEPPQPAAVPTEQPRPVVTETKACGSIEVFIKSMETRFGERPIFTGHTDDPDKNTYIVLTINPSTNTWSEILVNVDEDTACMRDAGSRFSPEYLAKIVLGRKITS